MKKYVLIIFILFFILGCDYNKENSGNEVDIVDNEEEKEEIILPKEPEYIDENPVIVGLYQDGKLVHEVTAPFVIRTDITSLDIYFTNEENVGGTNTKTNFNKYASNYQDVNKYKIGFIISFSVGDEVVTRVITGPKDIFILAPYIFNYLYDDVHQADGTWYSHVEEDQVNENTVYSSIKLFSAQDIDKVTSPITLTVFTYDTPDDFDENGMYRGNSKYSVIIKR